MCDFISWIEKDNKLFYLTDKEVFSAQGREKFSGCRDNDYLGHGAIRVFWGVKGGIEYERRDFWADDLPEELKNIIKDFDANFGKMWSKGYFQNDDLRRIVRFAPSKWAEKAWQQLFEQKPTNDDLRYIVHYVYADEWAEKVWQQLLKQKPTREDLRYIVCYAHDKWREKAWQLLSKQKSTNSALRLIVCYAPDKWREKAWQRLLKQKPTKEDLQLIVCYAPDKWAEEAWQQLFKYKPTEEDLLYITCRAPSRYKKGAQKLLSKLKTR
jgi:hypothetical protein